MPSSPPNENQQQPPPLLSQDQFIYNNQQQQSQDQYASGIGMPPTGQPQASIYLQQQQYDQHQQPSNDYTEPTTEFSSSNIQNDTGDYSSYAFKTPDSFYSKLSRSISGRYQLLLDFVTPHWAARWTFSIFILLVFMARIIMAQGWYVICYGLSIFYLNLFIGFLSPKIDPAFQAAADDDDFGLLGGNDDLGPMLPTRANDEFKPFIRRLPEFKFWLSATKATLVSLFLTLFEAFDLPVFWPILLIYFLLLFVSTMRQQIRHMIKYGYVPWDKGKKKYGGRVEEPSSLFSSTI